MKANLSKTLLSACLLTIQLSLFSTAFAASGGAIAGGGGDVRCYEYLNIMGQVVKELASAGQDKIDQINPLININKIIEIKQKLKCLPVDKLDRQARSYPDDLHTDLLVSDWEKLGQIEKIKLTSHELSVLAQYENDGEYFVSEDIIKLAIENSKDLKNQITSDKVLNNDDSSVTFIYPFVMIDKKKSYFGTESKNSIGIFLVFPVGNVNQGYESEKFTDPDSLCSYLGYSKSLAYKLAKSKNNTYASVSLKGVLTGVNSKEKRKFSTMIVASEIEYSTVYNFQTLTCK